MQDLLYLKWTQIKSKQYLIRICVIHTIGILMEKQSPFYLK